MLQGKSTNVSNVIQDSYTIQWDNHIMTSTPFSVIPLTARQCSRRGGDVGVTIVGDRVELIGDATVVLSGTLHNIS